MVSHQPAVVIQVRSCVSYHPSLGKAHPAASCVGHIASFSGADFSRPVMLPLVMAICAPTVQIRILNLKIRPVP